MAPSSSVHRVCSNGDSACFPSPDLQVWSSLPLGSQLMATVEAQPRFPSSNIILRTQVKFNFATLAI